MKQFKISNVKYSDYPELIKYLARIRTIKPESGTPINNTIFSVNRSHKPEYVITFDSDLNDEQHKTIVAVFLTWLTENKIKFEYVL